MAAAGTPSVNPGVAPRELSGTQLQSEKYGYRVMGVVVKFYVPEAFHQMYLVLLFLACDFSGLSYHVYKIVTTNHS